MLLCTTGAGGVGINLVPGCRVVLMDESWSPAVDAQAIDRVYREPQTRDVRVSKLLLRGTMDERVRMFQSNKQTIAALALGGYSGNPRTAKELRLLLGLQVSPNAQASSSHGASAQGEYDDLVG